MRSEGLQHLPHSVPTASGSPSHWTLAVILLNEQWPRRARGLRSEPRFHKGATEEAKWGRLFLTGPGGTWEPHLVWAGRQGLGHKPLEGQPVQCLGVPSELQWVSPEAHAGGPGTRETVAHQGHWGATWDSHFPVTPPPLSRSGAVVRGPGSA